MTSSGLLDQGMGQTVTKGATSLTASVDAADAAYNAPVTITAKVDAVAPATGKPSGVVRFWEGDDVSTLAGGFEWGLARALADELGLRVSFRDVPFPDIVTGELHGADVALAQVSITDEREDRVEFSVTYFDSAPAVLAPRDADDIHDLATARDRSWVVERATTEEAFVGDVVMRRHITPFLQAALDKGCPIQVGTDMLFEQIPAYLEFFGLPTTTPENLRALARLSY